ncbi:MAG: hypothetical protein LC685_00305 [Actinobacteria bacterium]|nr:hypothetical protein [Actinomycetota bacterium]
MERDLEKRIAANEDTFRDINDGIARGQWPGDESHSVSFRCECARLGCNLLIELKLAEYEAIRSNSRRFLVSPGHELPEVETVVATRENYLVVEKRDEAGREADRLDSPE